MILLLIHFADDKREAKALTLGNTRTGHLQIPGDIAITLLWNQADKKLLLYITCLCPSM
jgi:hypothetical protein